jgi:hypothetical protein
MGECSECERDLRGGHDPSCSRYRRRVCKCGHLSEDHDEEGTCWEQIAGKCGCNGWEEHKCQKKRAKKG